MKNIIEGWTKKLLGSMGLYEAPPYAFDRAVVCGSCDREEKGVCTMCGCYLEAKTLVKSETCPLNKWHQ